MSENPLQMSDDEYRAVEDIQQALLDTMNEALTTHGLENALEAMMRFTTDVMISSAQYTPFCCPVGMATDFSKTLRQAVVDAVEAEHE